MKKVTNYMYLLVCIVMLTALNNSLAADGKSIKKNYHITKPEGKNVNVKVKLTEASALALSHNRKSLWTVSDNKKALIFKMTLQGKSKDSESFQIINYPYERPDLEGVCLSSNGQSMYLVQERELAIIKVQLPPTSNDAEGVTNNPLSLMKNYSTKVEPYLGNNPNAGLEGITFHTGTNHISKNHFYIVSDKGQRLFHYDWDQNKVTHVRDLNYEHGEGVAYDPATEMLYIVTEGGNDEDSKLYTYVKESH